MLSPVLAYSRVVILMSVLLLRLSPRGLLTLRRPSTTRLSLDHFLVTSAFQIFEHAPFFVNFDNMIYLPGTVLYAYLHVLIVLWALLSLDKVVLTLGDCMYLETDLY